MEAFEFDACNTQWMQDVYIRVNKTHVELHSVERDTLFWTAALNWFNTNMYVNITHTLAQQKL
jgi:hypothetical protein